MRTLRAVTPTPIVAGLLLVAAAAGPARADPILSLPPVGRVDWRCGGARIAPLAELQALGVIAADELTTAPDYGTVRSMRPELGLLRIGVLAEQPCRSLSLVVRLDAAELLRIESNQLDDQTLATVDAVVDDAALWWAPEAWAKLIVGRSKVPFSRFRQLERGLLSVGMVPFLVDRVAPDRRWGVTALGDLGAIAYVGGIYADDDRLELVRTAGDPSAKGRLAMALHVEWTPRAPIGTDYQATPSTDPWYGEVRVSAGAGALYRVRSEGGERLDLSLSGQIKYRRYAAIAELMLASDPDQLALGGAGEASVMFADRVTVFGRGDYDASQELYSVGGGVAYFVTCDRRTKVSAFGWLRRPRDVDGLRRDGVVLQLQGAL